MHGLVLLDDGLRPLRPAILWNDQRTAAECDEIEQLVGLERLIALTGNRALTGFTAPKLLWVRRHEPDVYRRIAHVLLPKDYVRLRLTGELATDVSDASGTLLFDVGAPVLERGDARAARPAARVVPGRARVGRGLRGDRRRRAGGCGSAATRRPARSASASTGPARSRSPSARRASSSASSRPSPPTRAGRRTRSATPSPGRGTRWASCWLRRGSLDWLHGSVVPGVPIEALLDAAAVWEPGCEGLQFAPYLSGERTPHADPEARGAFVGLTLRHDTGALTRAVLEGVAYGLRDSLELLRGLGLRPSTGRMGGGGSRSELWRRIVASALDLPLEVTAADDAAALGAAMLAGVAAGSFADVSAAVESCVRVVGRIDPEPAWRDAYADGYAAFRRLYPAIASLRAAGA